MTLFGELNDLAARLELQDLLDIQVIVDLGRDRFGVLHQKRVESLQHFAILISLVNQAEHARSESSLG